MLACVVDGVTRDLNDQIFVGDARLAARRLSGSSPVLHPACRLHLRYFRQRVKTFTHDAVVAGGAGTGFLTGVFNLDTLRSAASRMVSPLSASMPTTPSDTGPGGAEKQFLVHFKPRPRIGLSAQSVTDWSMRRAANSGFVCRYFNGFFNRVGIFACRGGANLLRGGIDNLTPPSPPAVLNSAASAASAAFGAFPVRERRFRLSVQPAYARLNILFGVAHRIFNHVGDFAVGQAVRRFHRIEASTPVDFHRRDVSRPHQLEGHANMRPPAGSAGIPRSAKRAGERQSCTSSRSPCIT